MITLNLVVEINGKFYEITDDGTKFKENGIIKDMYTLDPLNKREIIELHKAGRYDFDTTVQFLAMIGIPLLCLSETFPDLEIKIHKQFVNI